MGYIHGVDTDAFDDHEFVKNLSDYAPVEDDGYLASLVVYPLTFVIGLVGNSLVVFALLCDGKAKSVTSSFLVSLAVADLLFLCVCAPYETFVEFSTAWVAGLAVCKLSAFTEMMSACASVLNLTAVSVERYVVIVHPMKSRSWCTIGRTNKILVAVWITAAALAAPKLHVMSISSSLYYNNVSYVMTSMCVDGNITDTEKIIFAWYQLIVMFVIPIVVIAYCYTFVIHVLWLSTKELAKMTQKESGTDEDSRLHLTVPSSTGYGQARGTAPVQVLVNGKSAHPRTKTVKDSEEVMDARKQVIKMLLAIIIMFFICWGPKLVLEVMKRYRLKILHTNRAYVVAFALNFLPFIQSCSNPIIYGFVSKNFRRSMRKSCGRVCHCDPCACECRREARAHDYELETKSAMGMSYSTPSRGYSPTRANMAAKTSATDFTVD